MKRFHWLIIPLLAIFISGCPQLVQEYERGRAQAERDREDRIRAEAIRRVHGRWPTDRSELGFQVSLARRRVEQTSLHLSVTRADNAENPTPATWEAYQRALAEFNDAEEALRRAERAWGADDTAYREAVRSEVEAIREEREREAREREERMRGGNGGGD